MYESSRRMLEPFAKAKGSSVEALIDEHPEELKRDAIVGLAQAKAIPVEALTPKDRTAAIAIAVPVFHECEMIQTWRWCRREGTDVVMHKAAHGMYDDETIARLRTLNDFLGFLSPEEAAIFMERARSSMGFFERLIYG